MSTRMIPTLCEVRGAITPYWDGDTLARSVEMGWTGDVGAAWYRARTVIRSHWRANLLLLVIVAVAGGVVLTTVAGARRASTAYDRFRDETLAADLDIAFDGRPSEEMETAFEQISSLPE